VTQEIPFDSFISKASAMIDERLPAHTCIDESDIPASVVEYCATLAASYALEWCGASTASIQSKRIDAKEQLDRWAKGIPILSKNRPASGNTALIGSSSRSNPRGWPTGGFIP
jgi:hypothetical protein